MNTSTKLLSSITVALVLAFSTTALNAATVMINPQPGGTFTTVNPSPHTDEPNLLTNTTGKTPATYDTSVINQLGSSSNLNFNSVTRISDGAGVNDQLWTPIGGETAQIQAVFAGDKDNFGYINGTGAGSFNQVIAGTGVSGYSLNPATPASLITGSVFQFALQNTVTSSTLSSENAQNGDLMDHMVTFLITDPSSPYFGDYILAFEDLLQGQTSADFDYNDTVVLVSGVAPLGLPEPSTYAILGSGLALALLLQRRRVRVAS